ncbi:aldehyde dehydrogenase [Hyaloscypha bicolor E]|uniref:Aldehyde dehydrogenase n=1 Tax=Hyaloscypha bicolor E TaxID=1095630 RepID=A0A2J6T6V2_9HELO|nr:aldehyde dehydrogenase [Hyaloscypha bicolor E]PMD58747.1 aldehyde dehydrogenase [Hyaloscypha bicolor E]
MTQNGTFTVPAIIDNKDVYFDVSFSVRSPVTGSRLHDSTSASVADALTAVESAQKAFQSWKKTKPTARRDIFLKAAKIVEKRGDELGKYMMDETAASEFWGSGFNVPLAVDMLKDVAGRIPSVQGSVPIPGAEGKSAMVWKEPYGVILGIAPWNAPYILGFRAIVFAIAAGNTVILKSSETSPPASGQSALIEDPRVKKINFTGSTQVGKVIGELAGRNLKPVLLELGGKAPAIVWEDADLPSAAQACAMGAFLYAGQICMSTERIIVHKNIAEAFEREFVAAAKGGWSGVQDLISEAGVEKNKLLIKDAVSKGASILHGELEAVEDTNTKMKPIGVKGVREGMDLYKTESFGPTVSFIVVDTEEEALRIANDTEYGLSAAVFTEDLRRGLRFAKEIESGAVHINGMSVHDESGLPHGGVKQSGYGRFGSMGMDELVRTKTVTYKD